MARTNVYDQGTIDAAKSSGGFAAFPAGPYILQIDNFERKPAANDATSPNHSKQILNVQFSIADGPQRGRVIFHRVPDFPRWAPSAKSPEGAVAYDHFSFYESLGVVFGSGSVELPEDRELYGRKVGAKIVVKPANQYNDAPFNEIKSFIPVSKVPASLPGATAPVVAAADWAPAAPPVVVTPTPGNPWGVPAAAAPAVPAAAWTPDPADVAHAEALVPAGAGAVQQGF